MSTPNSPTTGKGRWALSWRADPHGAAIADRHYNRQKIGAAQFVPPGRCLVLTTPTALWVTSWPLPEYVQHAWAGAWMCSAFRNEGPDLSSSLITEAVAATRWTWPAVPDLGMVTFVDPTKTRPKRDPGRCFRDCVASNLIAVMRWLDQTGEEPPMPTAKWLLEATS